MKATVEENQRGTVSLPRHKTLPEPTIGISVDIKTILVPLDFSRAAMEALDYAIELAMPLNAKVHLTHVQMPDEACPVPNAGHLMRECAESIFFLHENAGQVQAERPPQFWSENCHIQIGRPYEEICHLARELNIDLIVMASRGNTGLKRVVLGSTAERVVRFSPCPVLVVRRRKRKGLRGIVSSNRKFAIRKILAPVDFSECSIAGATYAAFLAKALAAKLCLFHALQPTSLPTFVDRVSIPFSEGGLTMANARLEMEAFANLDFLSNVKRTADVRIGSAVNEICAEASRRDVDLVVISTHGRTGFNHLLLGSVAEQVVRNVDCPIMVVPTRNSHS